jgi:hypothetical protein
MLVPQDLHERYQNAQSRSFLHTTVGLRVERAAGFEFFRQVRLSLEARDQMGH